MCSYSGSCSSYDSRIYVCCRERNEKNKEKSVQHLFYFNYNTYTDLTSLKILN